MRLAPSTLLRLLALLLLALAVLRSPGSPARAQEGVQEVVANLAAGRVVICVAGDGIAIGALESRLEPATRAPVIVPLSRARVGILLGAVDWVAPATGRELASLEAALPEVASAAVERPHPRLEEPASPLEQIGLGMLERLRAAAELLHSQLDLPEQEPVLELVVVETTGADGPEVWNLQFRIKQEPLRGDYWQTRVLRPSYVGLYPPDKHQPHTLIEVHYPADDGHPFLRDLLAQHDPRLARIPAADPGLASAVDKLVAGDSRKAHVADAANFLRAAFTNLDSEGAGEAIGELDSRGGFSWLLAPPKPPKKAETSPQSRPPGAPTLRKPD
jgi:hypothetical protein